MMSIFQREILKIVALNRQKFKEKIVEMSRLSGKKFFSDGGQLLPQSHECKKELKLKKTLIKYFILFIVVIWLCF